VLLFEKKEEKKRKEIQRMLIPGGILWLVKNCLLIGCLRHTHSSVLSSSEWAMTY